MIKLNFLIITKVKEYIKTDLVKVKKKKTNFILIYCVRLSRKSETGEQVNLIFYLDKTTQLNLETIIVLSYLKTTICWNWKST